MVAKPGSSYSVKDMGEQLIEKIKAVSTVKQFKTRLGIKNPVPKTMVNSTAMLKTTNKIIAIGASTGGTEAIRGDTDATTGRDASDFDRSTHATVFYQVVRSEVE